MACSETHECASHRIYLYIQGIRSILNGARRCRKAHLIPKQTATRTATILTADQKYFFITQSSAELSRAHSCLITSRNVTEIADLVPRLNVTNDEELSALAQETNSRLASFTRRDLAQHPAARTRTAESRTNSQPKIKHAMKDRGYHTPDKSTAIGHVSGTAEAPAVVVQMPDPTTTDTAPQPAPAPEVDQILRNSLTHEAQITCRS